MTDQNPHLPREQALELLSAELDGEFDAAARDLGFTPEVARGRLAATPDTAALRAALAGARARITVPTLDTGVRARLVGRALEVAPRDELAARRRVRFNPRLLGSVAAVALVVVGVVGALSIDRSHDGGDSATSGAADMSEESAPAPLAAEDGDSGAGDDTAGSGAAEQEAFAQYSVGDVTEDAVLQERAVELYARRAAATTDATETGEDTQVPTTQPLVDDRCVATRAGELGPAATLVARANATYADEAAEVLVFEASGSVEAIVVGPDCAELRRVSLSPQP